MAQLWGSSAFAWLGKNRFNFFAVLITLKKVLLRSSGFDPREPKKMDQKSLLRINLN